MHSRQTESCQAGVSRTWGHTRVKGRQARAQDVSGLWSARSGSTWKQSWLPAGDGEHTDGPSWSPGVSTVIRGFRDSCLWVRDLGVGSEGRCHCLGLSSGVLFFLQMQVFLGPTLTPSKCPSSVCTWLRALHSPGGSGPPCEEPAVLTGPAARRRRKPPRLNPPSNSSV